MYKQLYNRTYKKKVRLCNISVDYQKLRSNIRIFYSLLFVNTEGTKTRIHFSSRPQARVCKMYICNRSNPIGL